MGPAHRDALWSGQWEGEALCDAGQRAESLKRLELTLANQVAALGMNDTDTLETRSSLARYHAESQRNLEAIEMLEQVVAQAPLIESTLELLEAKCGLDHPDTKVYREALIKYYEMNGQPEAAAKLRERAATM